MRINAQNPRKKVRQTTQEKIWHKSAGASHKTVVSMQSETTGSYWTCARHLQICARFSTELFGVPSCMVSGH